jgi:hypothetical protein
LVCVVEGYDPYAVDPSLRGEVWEDTAGTASDSDVLVTFSSFRTNKEQEIRAEGDRRLMLLAKPYGPGERETWAIQAAEAEAWIRDNAAPTPMVDQIAANRGISKTVLVELIMENNSLFRTASGAILGQQQALLDRLYACTTIAAVEAIRWT